VATIHQLRERAEHWRTMIRQTTDAKAVEVMTSLAAETDAKIRQLEVDRRADSGK
jgi:hypothetical protein